MKLWRISITTTLEAEDAVTELLDSIFHLPVSSHFNIETGLSTVSVYHRHKTVLSRNIRKNIRTGLQKIKNCGLKIGTGRIRVTGIRRGNWAETWKRHFKPIEIHGTLLIKPSWSKRRARKNQAIVVLDPGLSFGTGQHPTTAFCLGEIVKRRGTAKTQSFLDLGTGSGILAIAAAKLGYQPIRAIDFDPESVHVARANAQTNRVHKKIRTLHGDVTKLSLRPPQQYHLVCANLTSDLLITQRQRIVAQLNSHGTLVLAGILKREFKPVQGAFRKLDLRLVSSKGGGEWRSGAFRFTGKKFF